MYIFFKVHTITPGFIGFVMGSHPKKQKTSTHSWIKLTHLPRRQPNIKPTTLTLSMLWLHVESQCHSSRNIEPVSTKCRQIMIDQHRRNTPYSPSQKWDTVLERLLSQFILWKLWCVFFVMHTFFKIVHTFFLSNSLISISEDYFYHLNERELYLKPPSSSTPPSLIPYPRKYITQSTSPEGFI